ncbi:hypothetical protein HanXRQr2_Chr17g0824791 [Helianthus annuus]|uniref:Uncharacterized protein n=2 Tax=Helianthus annuus TaxID=4232 RepID=A0A9K3DN33_HELAN|nr:hypothetical protein HanXRQr2_Chr17g0824791 [Helianthus annuus]
MIFSHTRVEGASSPNSSPLTHIFQILKDTEKTGGERGWGEIGEEMGERDGGDQRRDGRETRGRLLPRLQRQRGWLNHRNQGLPHMGHQRRHGVPVMNQELQLRLSDSRVFSLGCLGKLADKDDKLPGVYNGYLIVKC